MVILILGLVAFVFRRVKRLGAKMIYFNDINSFYPTFLCLLVAMSATLYSSIQLFAPESWRHYYYHPTLNPFSLPVHLGIFLASVWGIIIVGIATVDDIRRHLSFSDALFYYLALAGGCGIVYVVFSISTLYYIGYPLLVVYYVYAIRCYIHTSRAKYFCGRCGAGLQEKGVCPHCGAMNT
jgi:hypothetical protein